MAGVDADIAATDAGHLWERAGARERIGVVADISTADCHDGEEAECGIRGAVLKLLGDPRETNTRRSSSERAHHEPPT
jgi:hypothetical protein